MDIGTAKSLAKLFGILSTGCEREGKKLLNEKVPVAKEHQTIVEWTGHCFVRGRYKFGGSLIGLGITIIASKNIPLRFLVTVELEAQLRLET